jgi:phosphatidylglycerophosphate synthase
MPIDTRKPFGGDKKVKMTTLLAPYERRLIDWLTPKFPRWIETWHLTYMTIPWCVGLVVFGWLAGRTGNLQWLWLSSLMVFLQWFTDCFDGAVGRYKDTGLIRWGFYMDHFLDFVFMCAILVGYSYLFEGPSRQMVFFLIPVFGAFLTNSYLGFAATNEFKITYLGAGPTEARIGFIVLNTVLIYAGTAWLQAALPWVLGGSLVLLCFVVYRSSGYIWQLDMEAKAERG